MEILGAHPEEVTRYLPLGTVPHRTARMRAATLYRNTVHIMYLSPSR